MCVNCVCRCCKLRTGILATPFVLVTWEFSLLVIYWQWLPEFREYFSYSVPTHEDIYAAVILVCVDFVMNTLLVCSANKDYTGRNGDLRRWWYSLPWILVYGMNITGLLAAGIVGLFTLEGVKKAFGLLPLGYGCCLFLFFILVCFFILEQKHKLTGVAVRPFPSITSLVHRLEW